MSHAVDDRVVAPNRLLDDDANGYISFVGQVPKGKTYFYMKNLNPSLLNRGIPGDVLKALDFMRKYSPLFSKAYAYRMSMGQGVALVPIMGNGGENAGNNIVFGIMAGTRSDGTVVWPAKVIAHEYGHDYQSGDTEHPSWQIDSRGVMSDDPRFAIAPNTSEWYAYHFAEQVRAEVLQNAGLDIGAEPKYGQLGTPSTTYIGLLPPIK